MCSSTQGIYLISVQYPEALVQAFPEVGRELFLHVLKLKPVNLPPNNAHSVFYKSISSSKEFGILSTKAFPRLPSLEIYKDFGEIRVKIDSYKVGPVQDKSKIILLENFHQIIFEEILDIVKPFTVFDSTNLENNFLIVPGKF